ncbi:MAG: chemotaxis protein CheA [Chrysiogenetes bacterium]|nr:chemotaxis protein CheA [Chrysiogenetes bacterium]
MDMSKYKTMFVNEAQESLGQMDVAAAQLQRSPGNKELVDQLFRQAHSVKGMAASMGYDEIAELSHSVEDLMSSFRDGDREPDKTVIDLLVEGIDILSMQVDARASDAEPRNADEVAGRIRSLLGGEAPKKAAPAPENAAEPEAAAAETAPAEPAGGQDYEVHYRLSVDGAMGGLKAFLAYKRLETVGKVVSSKPSLADIKKGNFEDGVRVHLSGVTSREEIAKVLEAISEVSDWEAAQSVPAPVAEESEPKEKPTTSPKAVESTVRVRTSFLDYFINAVGELTSLRARLSGYAQERDEPELTEISDRLDAHVREIYAQVMNIRLMPLESVTSILPRTVRELGRKNGKEVHFEMRGQDLEVDRSILEVVLDPLIHLLRNAVDHGIETPGQREAAGKPREGSIRLLAFREREKTIIQITDDGRGIDAGKLRAKALGKGLITSDEAQKMSDLDAYQLICLPGLSTAEQVTETSGRGVGMDAVKALMERIGGSLQITSVFGQGTTFELVLPRSVAIVPVLMAGVGEQTFAFPLGRIVNTVIVENKHLQHSRGVRYYVQGGTSVPVVNLGAALGVPGAGVAEQCHLVLVERGDQMMAIEVDHFIGHQEAFIKPLGRPLDHIECLGGATVTGSGRPVFVIEVTALTPQGESEFAESVPA